MSVLLNPRNQETVKIGIGGIIVFILVTILDSDIEIDISGE